MSAPQARKTPAAAKELGVPYWHLMNLIRYGKLTPPARNESGDFLWTDADLEAARQALARRRVVAGTVS